VDHGNNVGPRVHHGLGPTPATELTRAHAPERLQPRGARRWWGNTKREPGGSLPSRFQALNPHLREGNWIRHGRELKRRWSGGSIRAAGVMAAAAAWIGGGGADLIEEDDESVGPIMGRKAGWAGCQMGFTKKNLF
jgi:hypothetical protein